MRSRVPALFVFVGTLLGVSNACTATVADSGCAPWWNDGWRDQLVGRLRWSKWESYSEKVRDSVSRGLIAPPPHDIRFPLRQRTLKEDVRILAWTTYSAWYRTWTDSNRTLWEVSGNGALALVRYQDSLERTRWLVMFFGIGRDPVTRQPTVFLPAPWSILDDSANATRANLSAEEAIKDVRLLHCRRFDRPPDTNDVMTFLTDLLGRRRAGLAAQFSLRSAEQYERDEMNERVVEETHVCRDAWREVFGAVPNLREFRQ